mmetsp:Transcript_6809/g.9410  ORF Transcript_6809/g.9410 Transcript_6809/m.9410 type:complete len:126 (-) Transcript_6809:43-420(-)
MDRIPKAFLLPTWELEDIMEMSKSYCEAANTPEPIISPIRRNRSTKSVAMLTRGMERGRAASIGSILSTSAPQDEPGFLNNKPETLRSKSYDDEEQVEVEVISSNHSKSQSSRPARDLRIVDKKE